MNVEAQAVVPAPAVELAGPGAWQRMVHVEHVWGGVVTIDVRDPELTGHHADAVAEAVAFLYQVDSWFSTYRDDTPIARLRGGTLDPSAAPVVVARVLAACTFARRLTGGVFDPWAVPGGLDPSGYVKGWAAGEVADRLVRAGVANVCVDASGDLACRGAQAPGEPWSIGIVDPASPREVVEVVRAHDAAIATSGLYERGAHVIDPRSGRAEVHYDSATIVGTDGGLADALATAALIAGPAAVAWFAVLPGWSAYFVKDSRADFFGPAFAHCAQEQAAPVPT